MAFYGSTQLPYNYAKNAGDPTLDNVNPPQLNGGGGTTPNQAGQANQPPKSQVQPNLGGAPSAPPQTFAQMQLAGYARPPMPAPTQPATRDVSGAAPPMGIAGPQGQTPPMTVAPQTGGLPSGFTLGTGAQYGNAFNNGQQLNGLVNDTSSPTGYSYSYVNGSVQPGATQSDWQNIINAENQNYFDQGNPGNPAAGAAIQASMPLNGGLNGGGLGGPKDAGTGLPPGYVAPTAPTATPVIPPQTRAAPTGGPSMDTTFNPMTLASGGAPPPIQSSSSGSNAPGSQPGYPAGYGNGPPPPGAIPVGFGNWYQPPPSPPPASAPQGYDILGALTGGAQGQGAGGGLQSATQTAAMNQLNNPSPYGQQNVKDLYNWLGGNIQDQFTMKQRALGEDMARRGLGTSTIGAGNLSDLNIGQRSAQQSMAQDLAQNYAQTLGQYQANAINQGNQVGTQGQQNQQNWLSQLMGYGEQGFQNDLATNALNQNATNNYQNYILGLLQYGGGG
jgi:hypothetical protein